MIALLRFVNSVVWGIPALGLIIGVGLCLTVRTRFAQVRLLPQALRTFLVPIKGKGDDADRSKWRALCTALAATVGTGNLAGVAGAIALGGPGAVFWMWVCGFLGMGIKLAEAVLAIRYRCRSSDGGYYGGPMYMIQKTMKSNWHWLACLYCFFGIVASFGVGNGTQISTVIAGMNSALSYFGIQESRDLNLFVGLLLGVMILIVMSKDVRGIGAAAERLVPFAAVLYIFLSFSVILIQYRMIPSALEAIVKGAFSPKAVTGGAVGSFFACVRIGAARGVFTNEAGMGTASMAHATANVKHPMEQGLLGIVEVFIDTIVICTLTALVILCSGVKIPYGIDAGITLTTNAFVSVLGQWVSVFISIALCLFAFATVLGWGLYGLQCARFLFGQECIKSFVLLQAIMAVISAVLKAEMLWLFSEIVNGLMAIPNLIVLSKCIYEVSSAVTDFERIKVKENRKPVQGRYATLK